MKTQSRLYPAVLAVAGGTFFLLLIPLVAMQFSAEVNWGVADFVLMGLLLFSVGMAYLLITRSGDSLAYRAGVAVALGAALLLIWANLAVGLIGSGPNLGNMMYIGVLIIGLAAVVRSDFEPARMERAMYTTAVALGVLAAVALVLKMHEYPGSSVIEVLGVNAFFASLFSLAGLFFRYAGRQHKVSDTR